MFSVGVINRGRFYYYGDTAGTEQESLTNCERLFTQVLFMGKSTVFYITPNRKALSSRSKVGEVSFRLPQSVCGLVERFSTD